MAKASSDPSRGPVIDRLQHLGAILWAGVRWLNGVAGAAATIATLAGVSLPVVFHAPTLVSVVVVLGALFAIAAEGSYRVTRGLAQQLAAEAEASRIGSDEWLITHGRHADDMMEGEVEYRGDDVIAHGVRWPDGSPGRLSYAYTPLGVIESWAVTYEPPGGVGRRVVQGPFTYRPDGIMIAAAPAVRVEPL